MKITIDIPELGKNAKPALFDSTLAFVVTHVAFPLLSLGAIVRLSWLAWETLEGTPLAEDIVLLVLATLIPLSAALLAFFRRKGVPLLASVAYAAIGIVYLYLFCCSCTSICKGVDSWILADGMYALLTFSGIMPLVFSGLARVAAKPLLANPAADLGVTVVSVFLAPAVLYFGAVIIGEFVWSHTDFVPSAVLRVLFGHLCALLFIFCTAAFFIALLRLLFAVRGLCFRRASDKAVRRIKALVFALVLPICGLALNRYIPFPADFQNAWAYGFTVFTAAVLFPEVTADRRGLWLFFARGLCLPFVLYFFIIFVPFLPLAIPAILAVGTGFLILAPTLLFHFYAGEIREDYTRLRTAYPRKAVLAALLAGAAFVPLGIALTAEFDRHEVNALLAWQASDAFDGSLKPFSPRRAARILKGIDDYTNGNEIPLISAWTTKRAYGGMYLDNALRAELHLRFTGQGIPEEEGRSRRNMNFFGEIWGASPARRSGSSSWWRSRPASTMRFEAEAVRAEPREADGGEAAYTVTVHALPCVGGDRELVLPFELPGGAWIAGMRLKMDSGEWKEGRVSERKAAEWVYRKITDQRRDPSIVTLDSPTEGTLKVFPVGDKGRDVELTVILPSPAASRTLVTFVPGSGAKAVATPDYPADAGKALFLPADASFPVVVTEGYKAAFAGEAVSASTNAVYLVMDESCLVQENGSAEIDGKCLEAALAAAGRVADAKIWSVQAHSTTTVLPYPERRDISSRGGLCLYSTLRTVLRHASGHLTGYQLPSVILVGRNWEAMLPGVKAAQWQAICEEFPGVPALAFFHVADDGAIEMRDYPIPGAVTADRAFVFTAEDGTVRLFPADGKASVVFADIAGGKGTRVDGARWNQGAALWRRDREGFLNPALDLRDELLEGARKCGVLTTRTSSLAVETSAQEKALRLAEMKSLGADTSLEFEEPSQSGDAPGMLLLLLAAGIVVLVRRAKVL